MKHAKKQTKRTGARASGRKSIQAAKRATRKCATPRGMKARDPRLPAPGTTITRSYKGAELRVEVLDEGFRWDGREFRSLTAVALAITGYPAISGPHFFGLDRPAATTQDPATA